MSNLTDILSSPIMQRLGWAIVHSLWQVGAVALGLAIILGVMRRSSSRARYMAACVAMVLAVISPIVTAFVVSPTSTPVASEAPAVPTPLGAWHVDGSPAVPLHEPADIGPLAQPSGTPHVIAAAPAPQAVAQVDPPQPRRSWLEVAQQDYIDPALPWATLAWLAGAVLLSIWHLSGYLLLQRIRHMAPALPHGELREMMDRLRGRLSVSAPVSLLESALVKVPTVIGWLRPALLMPVSALTGLSIMQVEAILAHELAHIRRYDALVRMLQAVVETLLFYHPALWWISGRVRQESEHCCDELALSVCGDRRGYAQALASLAGASEPARHLVPAASGGKLLPRIRRILGVNTATPRGALRSWPAAAAAILLLVVPLVVLSCAAPKAATPMSSEPVNKGLIGHQDATHAMQPGAEKTMDAAQRANLATMLPSRTSLSRCSWRFGTRMTRR